MMYVFLNVSVDASADLDLVVRSCVFSCVGTAGERCTTTRRLVGVSLYSIHDGWWVCHCIACM